MTVNELIKALESYKDFEVKFCFNNGHSENGFPIIRVFKNIDIADIGHSDKVILLSGEEDI